MIRICFTLRISIKEHSIRIDNEQVGEKGEFHGQKDKPVRGRPGDWQCRVISCSNASRLCVSNMRVKIETGILKSCRNGQKWGIQKSISVADSIRSALIFANFS